MKEETVERTSAIGSNKEAAITGVKREREIFDQRSGTRRRMTVDSRVSEFQTVDLYHWLWLFTLLQTHVLRNRELQKEREAEAEFYGGQVGELGELTVRERPSWEAWQSDSHM